MLRVRDIEDSLLHIGDLILHQGLLQFVLEALPE